MILKQQFGPDDKFFVTFDDIGRPNVTYSNVDLSLLHSNVFEITKQQYLDFLDGKWIPALDELDSPAPSED